MPVLVNFLVRHAVIGFAVAVSFVGIMTAFDVCGLRSLLANSSDGVLAVCLLTFALGLTFGSVQMGFAVMLMGQGDGPVRGKPVRLTRLVPSPLRIGSRSRRH